MRWNFHGLTIEGTWDAAPIGERWLATFSPRPKIDAPPDLFFHLALAGEAPPSPSAAPDFQQGELLAYYIRGPQVTAHFPRFGQLQLDLARGTTQGIITPTALTTHGVFEDLLAIGLSPHLRRRGMFLIHAFAATPPGSPPIGYFSDGGGWGGVLLVGDIGVGKTTTGLALLHAGWKLLSNDSPILKMDSAIQLATDYVADVTDTHSSATSATTSAANPERTYPNPLKMASTVSVLAYPGLLSAYPDSLARFPELMKLNVTPESKEKILFAAESIYPDVWRDSAPPAAIFFPQVEPRNDHALERLSAPEALQRILPHAIEQWDREMIPAHLALLNQLIQSVPAYKLRLGPEVETIPEVISAQLNH
jgi:hypothetical protein